MTSVTECQISEVRADLSKNSVRPRQTASALVQSTPIADDGGNDAIGSSAK